MKRGDLYEGPSIQTASRELQGFAGIYFLAPDLRNVSRTQKLFEFALQNDKRIVLIAKGDELEILARQAAATVGPSHLVILWPQGGIIVDGAINLRYTLQGPQVDTTQVFEVSHLAQ